jgi:hypothetical protein
MSTFKTDEINNFSRVVPQTGTYLPLLLWCSGWDSQRDIARTSACTHMCVFVYMCVCVCERTCLWGCNINLESANLEWNFHDNRVNKVNKLLKYNAKKCVKRKQHNILKTQHLQRSLYITTLTIFYLLQLHPFPIIQETKTFRYMLRITTVSVQNTTKNSPNAWVSINNNFHTLPTVPAPLFLQTHPKQNRIHNYTKTFSQIYSNSTYIPVTLHSFSSYIIYSSIYFLLFHNPQHNSIQLAFLLLLYFNLSSLYRQTASQIHSNLDCCGWKLSHWLFRLTLVRNLMQQTGKGPSTQTTR